MEHLTGVLFDIFLIVASAMCQGSTRGVLMNRTEPFHARCGERPVQGVPGT